MICGAICLVEDEFVWMIACSCESMKRLWGDKKWYCSQVGTFGTESAVRKRGGSRNLPYLNAKPRQIPLLGTYA